MKERTNQHGCKSFLKKKKAFTLVELLVVIAIIGILFVVLISKVDFATDKAKAKGVQTDFRSYQLALKTVGMEQQGFTNDMDLLAEQLNKNLDPKMQVAVVDGKLTTEAEDPWGTEYHIIYSEPENARGKIIITSAGQDRTVGTDDDYNIVIEYAITSTGGSVNIEFVEGHADGVTPQPGPGGSGGEDPIVLAAGIYDAENNLLADWETLTKPIAEGGLYGMDVTKSYNNSTYATNVSSPYYIITNNFPTTAKIVMDDNVTKIGSYAFHKLTSITDVELSENITTISNSAFQGCTNLQSVDMPTTMVSIGSQAFYKCENLASIVIPNNIQTIARETFYQCLSLASVQVPNSVTTIEESAFRSCQNLTIIDLPDSIQSIGNYAFQSCAMTTINLGTNLKTIGKGAFEYCANLIEIDLPSCIEFIGSNAFQYCTSFVKVNIPSLEDWLKITYDDGRFSGQSNPLDQAGNLYINNVLATNLIIPATITKLNNSAFSGCTSLKSVTFAGNLTEIEGYAFDQCTSLETVMLPESLQIIGDCAFRNTQKLTSITIPSSVTSVGKNTFYLSGITSITFLSDTPPTIGTLPFGSSSKLTAIYVPAESVDAYKAVTNLSTYVNLIQPIQ